MKVKYTGYADFQVFSAPDFAKAGVEGKKTTFPKGEPVEVSEEVGQALTSDEGIFANYQFKEVDEDEGTPRSSSRGATDDSEMADSGTVQGDTGTPTPDAGATTTRATRRSTR